MTYHYLIQRYIIAQTENGNEKDKFMLHLCQLSNNNKSIILVFEISFCLKTGLEIPLLFTISPRSNLF